MKLIEATAIGVALRPVQAFCLLDDWQTKACWLGAVEVGYYAHGRRLPDWLTIDGPMAGIRCRECWYIAFSPQDLGLHLNDAHRWSRERISLYLSQWEPPESEPEREQEPERELIAV